MMHRTNSSFAIKQLKKRVSDKEIYVLEVHKHYDTLKGITMCNKCGLFFLQEVAFLSAPLPGSKKRQ